MDRCAASLQGISMEFQLADSCRRNPIEIKKLIHGISRERGRYTRFQYYAGAILHACSVLRVLYSDKTRRLICSMASSTWNAISPVANAVSIHPSKLPGCKAVFLRIPTVPVSRSSWMVPSARSCAMTAKPPPERACPTGRPCTDTARFLRRRHRRMGRILPRVPRSPRLWERRAKSGSR